MVVDTCHQVVVGDILLTIVTATKAVAGTPTAVALIVAAVVAAIVGFVDLAPTALVAVD